MSYLDTIRTQENNCLINYESQPVHNKKLHIEIERELGHLCQYVWALPADYSIIETFGGNKSTFALSVESEKLETVMVKINAAALSFIEGLEGTKVRETLEGEKKYRLNFSGIEGVSIAEKKIMADIHRSIAGLETKRKTQYRIASGNLVVQSSEEETIDELAVGIAALKEQIKWEREMGSYNHTKSAREADSSLKHNCF